jgi:hypothetical protein
MRRRARANESGARAMGQHYVIDERLVEGRKDVRDGSSARSVVTKGRAN